MVPAAGTRAPVGRGAVATVVGDAALKAEGGVSERVTDVDGAVDADGGIPMQPVSNRPRTESSQRIRMQSACRENRIHDRSQGLGAVTTASTRPCAGTPATCSEVERIGAATC